jgi:DNA-binding transcriptional regulator LsrR (DeoR family)
MCGRHTRDLHKIQVQFQEEGHAIVLSALKSGYISVLVADEVMADHV